MMLLTILSRPEAERYRPGCRPAAIISVTDPGTEPCCFDDRLYRDVIRLDFHDVWRPADGMISEAQAARIARFLLRCGSTGTQELVIHCEAGISRSAGIGLAACRILDLDDRICFAGWRAPNRLVAARVLVALIRGEKRRRGSTSAPDGSAWNALSRLP